MSGRSTGWLGAVALSCACGPAVGTSDMGTSDAGSHASGATDVASTGTTGSSGPASSGSSDDDDVTTDDPPPVKFDAPSPDTGRPPGPVDPGGPPDTCELPVRPNAEITGTGAFVDLSLRAATFARSGGGKCPVSFDVTVAPDTDALSAFVELGTPPGALLRIDLILPDGALAPGTWEAFFRVNDDMSAYGSVEVTAITTLDAPVPLVEGSFVIDLGDGSIAGSFSAHYCDLLEGGTCGA
ncbi:MAG: hypothetical protein JNK45_18915 [Myxococcales bacterium]|nr:hypothetical protein [Myxococcales bacterium]